MSAMGKFYVAVAITNRPMGKDMKIGYSDTSRTYLFITHEACQRSTTAHSATMRTFEVTSTNFTQKEIR
jgi:hypothetical protein